MKVRPWINSLAMVGTVVGLVLIGSSRALAQEGPTLFKTYCAFCHEEGGDDRAPRRDVLAQMSPEQILRALEKGSMKINAAERSRAQRRILAEYLSGKAFGEDTDSIPESAYCKAGGTKSTRFSAPGAAWNGWGS